MELIKDLLAILIVYNFLHFIQLLFFISGPKLFSAFWVVMFYFTMIVFGLSQQMALVHTVASGLIAIRPDHFLQFESSLTFMSCLLGLVFSFPMATEVGDFAHGNTI